MNKYSKVRFKTKLGTMKLIRRGKFNGIIFWKVQVIETNSKFALSQETLIKNLIRR